jgi:methionyl aminopeptidase
MKDLMIGRNDLCWCGSGKKWKKCHFPNPGEAVDTLPFEKRATLYRKQYGIILKTRGQIEGVRRSGHLAAKILDQVCSRAQIGVTTEELNTFAHKLHLDAGAIPAPLGYGSPPYPKSICTSVNEVICHGIPDATPLRDGDIVNIDVTCILNGYYGDCSRMVLVGNPNAERRLVSQVSYECLMQAIEILKPGVPLSAIGNTIHAHANARGCSVVTQFVGHGVGIAFHEAPQIPHYRNSIAIELTPGMIFTIEPMINAGTYEAVIDKENGWTARTADGRASAQWEHTLLITETGHEILTPWTL